MESLFPVPRTPVLGTSAGWNTGFPWLRVPGAVRRMEIWVSVALRHRKQGFRGPGTETLFSMPRTPRDPGNQFYMPRTPPGARFLPRTFSGPRKPCFPCLARPRDHGTPVFHASNAPGTTASPFLVVPGTTDSLFAMPRAPPGHGTLVVHASQAPGPNPSRSDQAGWKCSWDNMSLFQ
jgi:hypothetical protein